MNKLLILLLLCVMASFVGFGAKAQSKASPVLNHMAFYVYDLEKSTDFYSNVIMLQKIPEPFKDGKHTWYKIAEHGQLHLIGGAEKEVKHDKNTHLCFSVPSLEEFIARLEKFKIDYTNWKGDGKTPTQRVDGVKQIYLQDPDGYWLEINNDKL